MPQNRPLFTDEELVAGLERLGGGSAARKLFAAEVGCHVSLVHRRHVQIAGRTGEAKRWDRTWDNVLRYRPTLAQIERLSRSHGDSACIGRWGYPASVLRQCAPDAPKKSMSRNRDKIPCGFQTNR